MPKHQPATPLPCSTAGILLREFSRKSLALDYAESVARRCEDPVMAHEYQEAAKQIRALLHELGEL